MKRPCSQAFRLCAKYWSAGTCATSMTSAVSAIRPKPAATRPGTRLSIAAAAMPTSTPCIAIDVVQAKACCGPKLSAVESVVAPTPSAVAPSTSAARRQPGTAMVKATRQGAIRPSTMIESSLAGASTTCSACVVAVSAQPAVQPSAGVPCSNSASTGCTRPSTWPRPKGTAVGKSRPIGQSTSSAMPPALRATNQRSRVFCQRSMPP